LFSSSQEILNYKGITISFPFRYETREVKNAQISYLNKDSVSYQAIFVEDTSYTARNEEQIDEYLKGLVRGFIKSIGTDFKTQISDSSIGGVRGKYVHLYDPAEHHNFKEVYGFSTLLRNQPYQIFVAIYGTIDETSKKRISAFFGSIKFEGKQL
jgi:hypothetical protein